MFPSGAGKMLDFSSFRAGLGVLREKLKICSLFDLYPFTVEPVKGYRFFDSSQKRPIVLSDRPDSPENRWSEGNKFPKIVRKRPRPTNLCAAAGSLVPGGQRSCGRSQQACVLRPAVKLREIWQKLLLIRCYNVLKVLSWLYGFIEKTSG